MKAALKLLTGFKFKPPDNSEVESPIPITRVKETPSLGSIPFTPPLHKQKTQHEPHPLQLCPSTAQTSTHTNYTQTNQDFPTSLTILSTNNDNSTIQLALTSTTTTTNTSSIATKKREPIHVKHPPASSLQRVGSWSHPVAVQLATAATRISKDSSRNYCHSTPKHTNSPFPNTSLSLLDTPSNTLNAELNSVHKAALPEGFVLDEADDEVEDMLEGSFNPYARRYSVEKDTDDQKGQPIDNQSSHNNKNVAVISVRGFSILRLFSRSSISHISYQQSAAHSSPFASATVTDSSVASSTVEGERAVSQSKDENSAISKQVDKSQQNVNSNGIEKIDKSKEELSNDKSLSEVKKARKCSCF